MNYHILCYFFPVKVCWSAVAELTTQVIQYLSVDQVMMFIPKMMMFDSQNAVPSL